MHSPGDFRMLLSIIVLAAIFGAIWVIRQGRSGERAPEESWPLEARPVLTEREQACYQRLVAACPDYIVLAQVALSQLIRVRSGTPNWQSVFARYRQLVADFVICRKDFTVVAVVELDDASHERADRLDADQRKTKAVEAAGLRLIMIPAGPIPSQSMLQQMLQIGVAPFAVPRTLLQEPETPVFGHGPRRAVWATLAIVSIAVVAFTIAAWWTFSTSKSARPNPISSAPAMHPHAPLPAPTPMIPAQAPMQTITEQLAEQKRQEAARAFAERQALDEQNRRKQAAWVQFYKQPASCEHPDEWKDQVECGNKYIRAKREFEKRWAAQNGLPAPQ